MGNEASKASGAVSSPTTNTARATTAATTTKAAGGGSAAAAPPTAATTSARVQATAPRPLSLKLPPVSPSSPQPEPQPHQRPPPAAPLPKSAPAVPPAYSSAPQPIFQTSSATNVLSSSPRPMNSGSRPLAASADIPTANSFSNLNTDNLGSSVPRYVDANSMVYTIPSFASENSLSNGTTATAGAQPQQQRLSVSQPRLSSTPVPLAGSGSTSDFRVGTVSSPLSPVRRHFPNSVSSPIAIPTYNTTTTSAVEELSCSSPVLRSYRQHSFSTSRRDLGAGKSPTSPFVSQFGSASFNGSTVDLHASLVGAGGGASSPAPGGSPTSASYTKFLEITGYPLGLENYGNTCYCNSVIQLIYHCTPLRLRLLELYDVFLLKKGKGGFEENTVLFQLCSLIAVMHKSNNRSKEKYPREKIAPKELLQVVRSKNEAFNNDMQQDAHEFTMFLLSDIVETEQRIMADPANANAFLQNEAVAKKKSSSFAFWKSSKDKSISSNSQKVSKHDKSAAAAAAATTPNASMVAGRGKVNEGMTGMSAASELTPLQVILQGQFGSLTACLECDNITARDEVFIDLSLETAQGCSLLRCLDHFGDPEYFWGKNKVRCDECHMPVRAAKTIHVQQLPQYALLIHLKRFQYDVKRQNFTKKADHVALPMQMDVEEYLTDPEVVEKSLRTEEARSQKERASGSDRNKKEAAAAGSKSSSPDTFKPASEEVRQKLRGMARHKARFELTGFVAHIGEGPNSGHYFTCVRYGPQLWRRFDDETVSTMAERDVQQYFGVPSDATGVVTTTAYILLYERVA